MKKFICCILTVSLLFSMGSTAFAETDEEPVEPQKVGRHYTEKVEVVADRKSKEYVYPADVTPGGAKAKEAVRRAYVFSEKHYIIYQKRVGNDTYKRKLYDEYHTTWQGEWRYAPGGEWHVHPDFKKKTQITKERSPIGSLFLGLM